jgi:hypothetical protein
VGKNQVKLCGKSDQNKISVDFAIICTICTAAKSKGTSEFGQAKLRALVVSGHEALIQPITVDNC